MLAIETLAHKAAEDIRKTKEDTIRLTLDKLIGKGQYTLEDVKDRGQFREYRHKPGEQEFWFDGRAIIWFGVPTVNPRWQDQQFVYSIDMPYQILCVEALPENEL